MSETRGMMALNFWSIFQLALWIACLAAPFSYFGTPESPCPDLEPIEISLNDFSVLTFGSLIGGFVLTFIIHTLDAVIKPDSTKWSHPRLQNNPFAKNPLQFSWFGGIAWLIGGVSFISYYLWQGKGLEEGVILLCFGLGTLVAVYGSIRLYRNIVTIM